MKKAFKRLWIKVTNWESWHYHIKYIPIAPFWLWYCLKARSFWFFTTSNPSITFGGFEGEGKREIYRQLPEGSFPKTIFVHPEEDVAELKEKIRQSGISFPFVVKPDVGAMGYLFRRIENFDQLVKYHRFIGEEYLVQEWVGYPIELSIFYYRMPDSTRGRITGMLMKEPPFVRGDGYSTVSELIHKNEVLKNNYNHIAQRHQRVLHKILPTGKKFVLSHASNRSQGGILKNLDHEIDDQLCSILDQVSNYSKNFFYGRFDIKCESLDALRQGRDFYILEYNGSGAGVQHIYGNNLSLYRACKMIVHHWQKLSQISQYNNRNRQIPYWSFLDGTRFLKRSMRHLRKLKMMDRKYPV